MLMKKELIDDNRKLREENKKLKSLCDKYEEEHRTTFEEWKKTISIIDELEKELKDRIKNVPDTMAEVEEDESILYKLQELKGADKE